MNTRIKPVVLLILDGWGLAPDGPGNAISQAQIPNMKRLWENSIHTQLIAHGESVGLPRREPGNTETGHLNLGAGHIVYQDLPRINMAIADGSFFQNSSLLEAANHVRKNNSALHLMGLIGGGGVHSDLSHFFALLRLFHEQNVSKVFIHIFTDGRDSPPTSAMTYIKQLQTAVEREHTGVIASVTGRYFAMDRDFRWDRTEKTYVCLTEGKGKTAPSIEDAVSQAYTAKQSDEFIEPTLITGPDQQPLTLIRDNDAVVFVNFRIDRPRQLSKAFVLPDFANSANSSSFDPYMVKYNKKHDDSDIDKRRPFTRNIFLKNLYFVTMTEYETGLPAHIAFPPQAVENSLGQVVSSYNLHQLRMAETEKERFVTYYFNGMVENAFPNEERIIIPSPKVPTYDKKPEMSVMELTDKAVAEVQSGKHDLIVINFANADMVGHTGNIKATVLGCEAADSCVGRLEAAVTQAGGILLITADHGNAEEMLDLSTGGPDTEHNANPVPFIAASPHIKSPSQIPQGIPADIAPTILGLLQIPPPVTMTGRNLLANLI